VAAGPVAQVLLTARQARDRHKVRDKPSSGRKERVPVGLRVPDRVGAE